MSDTLEALEALDEAGKALLFTDARTANTFAETPVSDEDLIEIWELAKWAPTSANLQPMRVTYVNSPEARERLVANMSEGNKAKTLAAPAVALLAVDYNFHEHIPAVMPGMAHMQTTFADNDEMRKSFAGFNAALQAGYFVLAVRAQGLAAGPMTGFDAAAIDADFFADGRHHAILVVNIGHPIEGSYRDRMPRLDNDSVVRFA